MAAVTAVIILAFKNIMKHNSDVPGQLALFAIAPTEAKITVHDPYWDEILAPQQEEDNRWNPAHFGEVPHKVDDGGQLSIFYEDVDEPPDPDDFQNLHEYHQAYDQWEIRVGAQVKVDTKKFAPQHDTHWVEKYWVERSGNKYWYFRYCWMTGRKKNRLYLGSVNSIIARRKKADVEVWIADGKLPVEIKQLIQGWKYESSTMPKVQRGKTNF